jgi:hypothetical protein
MKSKEFPKMGFVMGSGSLETNLSVCRLLEPLMRLNTFTMTDSDRKMSDVLLSFWWRLWLRAVSC